MSHHRRKRTTFQRMGCRKTCDAQDPCRQIVRAKHRDKDWDHDNFTDDEWEDFFGQRYRYDEVDDDIYYIFVDSGVLIVPMVEAARLNTL